MSTPRKEREERRNLNVDEMYAMGFAELREHSEENGWAYPDDDDEMTTEDWWERGGKHRS